MKRSTTGINSSFEKRKKRSRKKLDFQIQGIPAFFTACEKMRHNEPKSKNPKAKKRINFDQQVMGTQNQKSF